MDVGSSSLPSTSGLGPLDSTAYTHEHMDTGALLQHRHLAICEGLSPHHSSAHTGTGAGQGQVTCLHHGTFLRQCTVLHILCIPGQGIGQKDKVEQVRT